MTNLFTKQEKIFISFLLVGILVGSGIELYQSHFPAIPEITQAQKIEDVEKQLNEKTILIDSLLDNKMTPGNRVEFSPNQNIATIVKRGAKSNPAVPQIDINRATIDELVQLPNIGRVIASRIVEYRSAHGEFKSVEELMNIKGIGEKKLKLIKPYIYIQRN